MAAQPQTLAHSQSHHGQDGSQSVGQDVEIGGPEIGIVVRVMVMVIRVVVRMMVVMMVMVLLEQEGAGQVDRQPDDRHHHGLVEVNGYRVDQPPDRPAGHNDRDDRQKQGAGVSGQIAHLPRAKGKPGIVLVPPGQVIGQGGDPHGRCVAGQYASRRPEAPWS